jgi:hypothetical protein
LIRRKRDQDSAALIEEAKHKEQLRQIEKDKRLKREELEAKKKIKAQIEADKQARKEKVPIPLTPASPRLLTWPNGSMLSEIAI